MAVNALGDIYDVETGKQIAGLLDQNGKLVSTEEALWSDFDKTLEFAHQNTTLGTIFTNARFR